MSGGPPAIGITGFPTGLAMHPVELAHGILQTLDDYAKVCDTVHGR